MSVVSLWSWIWWIVCLTLGSIFRSLDAIASQKLVCKAHDDPHRFFLHELFRHHQHLARVYVSQRPEERGKPLIATLSGLEVGRNPIYTKYDTNKFIMPPPLLHRSPTSDPTTSQASSSILLVFTERR